MYVNSTFLSLSYVDGYCFGDSVYSTCHCVLHLSLAVYTASSFPSTPHALPFPVIPRIFLPSKMGRTKNKNPANRLAPSASVQDAQEIDNMEEKVINEGSR